MRKLWISISAIAMLGALTACDGDHWGSEKKEKLTGQRVAIALVQEEIKVAAQHKFPAESTKVVNNIAWPVSIANSVTLGGNLQLQDRQRLSGKGRTVKIKGNTRFGLLSTPLVTDKAIYLLDSQGDVSAFTQQTGKKMWSSQALRKTAAAKSQSFLSGGVMLANNVIYATAGLNAVVALDAESGKQKWGTELRSASRAVPVLAGKVLLVQSLDNMLYGLDAQSGEILWAHIGMGSEAQALVPVMPAVDRDGIIVQYSTGEIYKLSLQDGEEVWHTSIAPHAAMVTADQTISRTALMPLLHKGGVFVISPEGKLFCLRAADGEVLWHKELYIDNGIWLTDEYIYAITREQKLLAISQKNGLIKWQTDIAAHLVNKGKNKIIPLLAAPIVAGGQVIVNTSVSQQLRFNVADGSFISSVAIGGDVTLPSAVVAGQMYTLTNGGVLSY